MFSCLCLILFVMGRQWYCVLACGERLKCTAAATTVAVWSLEKLLLFTDFGKKMSGNIVLICNCRPKQKYQLLVAVSEMSFVGCRNRSKHCAKCYRHCVSVCGPTIQGTTVPQT